jgi:hypothetical protein
MTSEAACDGNASALCRVWLGWRPFDGGRSIACVLGAPPLGRGAGGRWDSFAPSDACAKINFYFLRNLGGLLAPGRKLWSGSGGMDLKVKTQTRRTRLVHLASTGEEIIAEIR